MAKIKPQLRELDLDGLTFAEVREALDRAEKDFPGYDTLQLHVKAEIYDPDEAYAIVNVVGVRDETPEETAKREAGAVAAERRELDWLKAKVAEIEARLAGK